MLRVITLALLSLFACDAYKFLINSPIFGFSHTNFMGAIADALTEAGHDVTVLMPVMDFQQKDKTGLKLTKKVIKVETDPLEYHMTNHEKDMLSGIWRKGTSVFGLLESTGNMTKSFVHLCKGVFEDEQLLKRLEEEKFDVGITEVFDICGLGIFEILKIPATIAATSGGHIDCISESIGEPIMPSYVPGNIANLLYVSDLAGWSVKGDRMNFFDRFENLLAILFGKTFYTRTYDEQIKAFRKKFGSQFKGYRELIARASFIFTNSNPYLDYPRALLQKTVPIGGITVSVDPEKNQLSKEWNDILNERNTTVLVSFGSVAKSIYMPEEYKTTLLEVFESMPETTFILKYEEEGSKMVEHLKNVHLSTWVPQNALLADPRLTVFVTHGGLGSVTELAHIGKPAILIPIFADQTRNARMFSKHGCGIVLTKYDLAHPRKLRESLYKIFSDASFSENSRRLSEILRNQPICPKELLVKHSEFAARFGSLPNLDAYGRHLSLVQYYLIDVVLACTSTIVLVVFIIVKLLRKIFFSRRKEKQN